MKRGTFRTWSFPLAAKALGAEVGPYPQEVAAWDQFSAIFGAPEHVAMTTPARDGHPLTIRVRPDFLHQVSTTAHELAHIALGQTKTLPETLTHADREKFELLAERTGEIVCGLLGEPYDPTTQAYVRYATPAAKRYVAEHEADAQAAAKRIVAAGLGEHQ